MAAILYLDVDDEITSAAARMRDATDERLVLVLPYGSHLATSRINFRLLAREAESHGRTLEVVAPDAAARALAASAGLAVHPSVAAYEAALTGLPIPGAPVDLTPAAVGSPAPAGPPAPAAGPADDVPTARMPSIREGKPRRTVEPPRRRPEPIPDVGPRRPIANARTLAAGLAVVLVLLLLGGVAAFTLLPSATIVLTPAAQAVGPLELSIVAEPNVTVPDPAALVVPARRFTYDVVVTSTFPATGVRIEEATAAGSVTFQNCDTGRRARIPGGSIVKTTSGVSFETQATITVERATVNPFDCKTGDVDVVAVTAGVEGNVAAGAIKVVPDGFDPEVLFVGNPAPTSGGVHEEFPTVSQADVDSAQLALESALGVEFDRQLADTSTLPEGTTLFPETKQLGDASPSVDPATLVGLEEAEFELGLTAEGSALGVDPGPVNTIADVQIRSAVDAGFQLDETSIDTVVHDPVVASGTVTFPVTVTAREIREVDRDSILAAIRGLPLHEARLVLDAVGTATIDVWPDWVTTIPTIDGRVTLTIESATGPEPSATVAP